MKYFLVSKIHICLVILASAMRLHYCIITYIHGPGTSVMNYVSCYWLVKLIMDKALD